MLNTNINIKYLKFPLLFLVVLLLISIMASPVYATDISDELYDILLSKALIETDAIDYFVIKLSDEHKSLSVSSAKKYVYDGSSWSLTTYGGVYGSTLSLSNALYAFVYASPQSNPNNLGFYSPWVTISGDSYSFHNVIRNEFAPLENLTPYYIIGPDYIFSSHLKTLELSNTTYTLEGIKSSIVYSTVDITDSNGNIIYSAGSGPEYNAVLDITQPMDWLDFKDSSYLQTISATLTVSDIDSDFDINKLTAEIYINDVLYTYAGPSDFDYGAIYTHDIVYTAGGFSSDGTEYYLSISGSVCHDRVEGKKVVSIYYYYDGELLTMADSSWTYIQGFVDEDNDGKDDRTGRTYLEYEAGNPHFVESPFGDFTLEDFPAILSGLLGALGSIFSAVYSILPPALMAIIITIPTLYIILRIIGR